MLHFDLNLALVLRDVPFSDRFDEAARLGFDAVEFYWPSGEDLGVLAQKLKDTGLRTVCFSFDAGDLAAGDRGLISDLERHGRFRANVPAALDLAHKTGCKLVNVLIGKSRPGQDRETQLELARDNLRWAADQARDAGVTLLVEVLNSWENPGYLLGNTREAMAFIAAVGAVNVKYLFDMYHLQRMEGNIAANLQNYAAHIGHIQIADSPGRNQPGTGELNFRFIFQELERLGYSGHIGLEYFPKGTPAESMTWLPPDRRRGVSVSDIEFRAKTCG